MRDTIFISHANPEDNEFSLWLALQLASQGYRVWCDLTRLLGGEDFWEYIEGAIRTRTVKFLFVLSKKSNHKPGAVRELAVADAVARSQHLMDFVIPLKVDDLPYAEVNIRLQPLNSIAFHRGWAMGLKRLLEKLEEDEIPKDSSFSPTTITSWWRVHHGANHEVWPQPEDYLTNWFPVQALPQTIQLHRLVRYGPGITELSAKPPFPAVKHGAYLISFAPADDLRAAVASPVSFAESVSCSIETFQQGSFEETPMGRREAQRHLANIMRQAWELAVNQLGLPVYELSGGVHCFYFKHDMLEQNRAYFTSVDGRNAYRQLVGFSTVSRRSDHEPTKRYWHFGLQLKSLVYPTLAFAAKPHVLFSSDGQTIWDNTKRLHRARRSECKDWWNEAWRDRILASMAWLSNGNGEISLPLASELSLSVALQPLTLTSPVTFRDPDKSEVPVNVDLEDAWDEDEEEEDEG